MIQKKRLKSRQVTKLTFELPVDYQADAVELVAEFTNWQPVPFERLKNGKWKLVRDVESDRSFQFRYRGKRAGVTFWDEDSAADTYVQNPFGTRNAVVVS